MSALRPGDTVNVDISNAEKVDKVVYVKLVGEYGWIPLLAIGKNKLIDRSQGGEAGEREIDRSQGGEAGERDSIDPISSQTSKNTNTNTLSGGGSSSSSSSSSKQEEYSKRLLRDRNGQGEGEGGIYKYKVTHTDGTFVRLEPSSRSKRLRTLLHGDEVNIDLSDKRKENNLDDLKDNNLTFVRIFKVSRFRSRGLLHFLSLYIPH